MNCFDKKEIEKMIKELSFTNRMTFYMMLLLLMTREKIDNSQNGEWDGKRKSIDYRTGL